ncbi:MULTISPECIES: O-methyltransferase [Paenibacillus]|uniref:O-methyltransferase n=1 Tax=Paenibacillus radicis (ex Xue et al. 2023) TaxID=2972489 RepID=A0ABT1YI45_9BACL|nr:O-methyltransferase [Paenibacillus radicis (ex Xue et al. 2023)]MCR8632854.1 O-methyltransferase [Paenibacillus radicis (ex Xue et al. 2023)]
MILENVPLARQLEIVFREIKEELTQLTSGTVFVQIRNNVVGKFGVRAFPLESKGSQLHKMERGLSDPELQTFRMTAMESLKLKNWSHGEIQFEFAKRQDKLCTSVAFESNYNMASIITDKEKDRHNK